MSPIMDPNEEAEKPDDRPDLAMWPQFLATQETPDLLTLQ